MFHPGPLGKLETQWVYVDCVYLVSPRFPLEEREWLTILNPNQEPAHCVITFIPGGDVNLDGKVTPVQADLKPVEYSLTVSPERICPTNLADLAMVLANQPYAVRVRSDLPITVQGIRHIFERGKYEFSRCWAVLDAYPIADPAE
jgi:hypothetical protein